MHKFLVNSMLIQDESNKGNAKSFPDATKKHVTFGQNVIVEIESDKSKNKKSIKQPLKSKPNEELPKSDVISNSSKRNSKEKDKEKV